MEPDFDDLYEDYLQESNGEPPEFYEEDEWEVQAGTSTAQPKPPNGSTSPAVATGSPATPSPRVTTTTNTSALFASPEQNELFDVDDDDSMSVHEVYASNRREKKDPFAFERYKEDCIWRDETVDSPNAAMRATQWKSSRATTTTRPSSALDLQRKRPKEQTYSLLRQKREQPDFIKLYCTYHPLPGDTRLSFTCRDGSRMYVRVQNANSTKNETTPHPFSQQQYHSYGTSSSLLGVSMNELMRRVQLTRRRREHEQLEQVRNSATPKEEFSYNSTIISPSPTTRQQQQQGNRMWVDKYAPSSFAHLLSDERTNRDVVRALRAWDPYVFHRDPPPARPEWGNHHHPHFAQPNASINPRDLRPDPSSRVLLLSGPPGIGKTTLAHILARHVGYNPVEVNSSDDRSAQVLRERITALESNSVINHHKGGSRPRCLILDEIDGVDAKGAIQALVDIVRAEIPAAKSKKKAPYLRRPVILICNNKYAPALRPILPYCRHFNLSSPSQTRLVARLRACLQQEQFVVSGPSVLHQLGSVACGDIRSCLHTLQFVASRARQLAGSPDSSTSNVDMSQALLDVLSGGQKDVRNDIASTVTAVFRKEKSKAGSSIPSVARILEVVQAFGDNARILDCLFVNILGRVSYIDPTMDKCYAAHEWLSEADLYRNGMEVYIPPAAAAIHLLCSVEQRPDLVFTTRSFSDAYYQLEANQALLNKFVEGLSPHAASSRSNGCKGLAMETVPYSLWILSAGEGSSALDRAVTSFELLNSGEMAAFQKHKETLKSLGLTYSASTDEKNDRQQLVPRMRLEPPIDQIAQYGGLSLSQERSRREISPAIKELIAQKVAHENMRSSPKTKEATKNEVAVLDKEQSDTAVDKSSNSLSSRSPGASSSPPKKRSVKDLKDTAPLQPPKRSKVTAQNFLLIGAKKAKETRSARNAARVGFLRSQKNKLSHTGSGVPFSQVIRLKFCKGFTEAVRAPCKLGDLR